MRLFFFIHGYVIKTYLTDTTDYNFTTLMKTIPAGTTYATFNVPILQDQIVEENETFYLFIDNILPSHCSMFNADPRNAEVIIIDDGMYVDNVIL